MKGIAFVLDVMVPALQTVMLLSAALAYIYVEDLWVFAPGRGW